MVLKAFTFLNIMITYLTSQYPWADKGIAINNIQ